MKNETALFFRDNDKKSGLTPNKKSLRVEAFYYFGPLSVGSTGIMFPFLSKVRRSMHTSR